MTEKEHLEKWLLELNDERDRYTTQLGTYHFQKTDLHIKRRMLQQMMFQHDTESVNIGEHLNFDSVNDELAILNSDDHKQEERLLQEKIHTLALAIQKIEHNLKYMNTPA